MTTNRSRAARLAGFCAVLVLFGGSQLPKLAKNLGKAQKEFKDGLSEGMQEDEESADSSSDSAK